MPTAYVCAMVQTNDLKCLGKKYQLELYMDQFGVRERLGVEIVLFHSMKVVRVALYMATGSLVVDVPFSRKKKHVYQL